MESSIRIPVGRLERTHALQAMKRALMRAPLNGRTALSLCDAILALEGEW